MLVGELTTKDAADVPPKETADALVKFVPVIVTSVPVPIVVGETFVIVGAGIKVKLVADVATPLGVVTWIGPVATMPV